MPEPVDESEQNDEDEVVDTDEELANRPDSRRHRRSPERRQVDADQSFDRRRAAADQRRGRHDPRFHLRRDQLAGPRFPPVRYRRLRRRSRIEEKLEKLSVADALRAIRFAEVVVLMMDSQNKFEEQDLRIADLIEREGRAIVIAVTKWDLIGRAAERRSARCAPKPTICCRRSRACRWLRSPA